MTTRKTLLVLVALALLILVIYQQLFAEAEPPRAAANISVVVASRDIPPYTLLTSDYLTKVMLPADEALDSYGSVEEVISKLRMTSVEMRSGNVINRSNVLEVGENWSDDTLIGSFRVDTANIIGGQLRPGHHIDLLVTRPETRDQEAVSMWLARDLWVVGVYQAGGDDVLRPTVVLRQEATPETTPAAATGGLGLGGFAGSSSSLSSRQGPANLVVVAVPRETAKMISDYLGARLYSAWVYVRPGGATINTGRIDGQVFQDDSRDLVQQRDELGLDGVAIALQDADGNTLANATTASGGLFTFDDLDAGIYYVEETDLEGYSSLTANRIRVEVSAGQNLHVQFADLLGDITAKAAETPLAVATALPCGISAFVSESQGGAPKQGPFRDGTNLVGVTVEFQDCAKDMPFAITTYYAPEAGRVQQVANGNWKGGSGKISFLIKPWQGDTFQAGSYVTLVKTGADQALAAVVPWNVAAAVVPETTPQSATTPAAPTPVPGLPITGVDPATPTPEPVTLFGFSRGY